MSLLKIEGFDKSSSPQILINKTPLKHNVLRTMYGIGGDKFGWGDTYLTDNSLALARAILMTVVEREKWELANNRLAKAFLKECVSGWGDGDFSVEIDMRKWLAKHGYEYIYTDPILHKESQDAVQS